MRIHTMIPLRFCLSALIACLAAAASIAAPEPEAVPRRWQLRLDPGDLRVAIIDTPGVGERMYLYMTYKVVNNSGEDRDFAPWFELATDSGQIVRAGRDVPHAVVQELLRRIDSPFLQDDLSVQGRLLQGQENAREGLVVWNAPDITAGEYTVFAMGFSGPVETDVIKELQLPVVARGRFRGLDANDKDYRVKGHKKLFAAGDIRHARASSCGPSAKAARPPTPSTASSWARATCQGRP